MRDSRTQKKNREADNSQILSDVGVLHMTPEQVAQFLKRASAGKFPRVNPDGIIVQEETGHSGENANRVFAEENPSVKTDESTAGLEDTADKNDSEKEKVFIVHLGALWYVTICKYNHLRPQLVMSSFERLQES